MIHKDPSLVTAFSCFCICSVCKRTSQVGFYMKENKCEKLHLSVKTVDGYVVFPKEGKKWIKNETVNTELCCIALKRSFSFYLTNDFLHKWHLQTPSIAHDRCRLGVSFFSFPRFQYVSHCINITLVPGMATAELVMKCNASIRENTVRSLHSTAAALLS